MAGGIINTNLLFVSAEMDINGVVRTMIERNVSSALVIDHLKKVVGIVTERDIVRKFTLIDMQQKGSKKINTIMTRNLHFARLSSLKKDIIDLHFKYGLRHFPVLLAREPLEHNVVGMVTVTDICEEYLKEELANLETAKPRQIGLLHIQPDKSLMIDAILSGLGYEITRFTTPESATSFDQTLVVDVSEVEIPMRDRILAALRQRAAPVIVLNTERPAKGPLARFCEAPGRVLLTTPLDLSYLDWILARTVPTGKRSRQAS